MEYTLEITQYCEHNCPYCSSNATTQGQHVPLEKILEFLEENNINENDRINISGGEPLAHPQFYKILQECYKRTKNVWVYTNAIRNIKYNAHVLREFEWRPTYAFMMDALRSRFPSPRAPRLIF